MRKILLCLLFTFSICASFAATRNWVGIGAGGSGTDFNLASNWLENLAPNTGDQVIMNLSDGGTITFSAAITNIQSLVITFGGNNKVFRLDIGSKSFNISGTTSCTVTSGNANTEFQLSVGNGGTLTHGGTATFAGTGAPCYFASGAGGTTGTIIYKGDLVINSGAITSSTNLPGKVIFDGLGSQSIRDNSPSVKIFPLLQIGLSNLPTVTLSNSSSVLNGVRPNDLTINGTLILPVSGVNNFALNRNSSGGGTLLMNAGSVLKLEGISGGLTGSNFPANYNNVTLDSTSTVEFNGAAQTIPQPAAAVYGNLTLSGSGTKTVGGNISINRALDIAAGVTMALGENTATLKSNAQTTAFVRPVNGTITYGTNGAFVVERHLYAKKSWRLLATPVQASTLSITNSWREGIAGVTNITSTGFGTQITGPATSIGMDQTTPRGSLKWFDQSINNYREITNTGDAIARPEGYYVFVRGDRAQTTTGLGSVTNLRLKGKILTGTQPDFNISAGKFASVGNPYPSAIDMRNVSKTGGTVNGFITWNPNSTQQAYGVGGFETYNYNSGSNNYERVPFASGPVKNFIQSGEAVFVQATGSNGKIIFEENDKVNGSKLESRTGEMVARTGIATPTLEMNLHSQNSDGSSFLADGFRMDFNSNYDNAIDNLDFRKVNNNVENLAIRNNNYSLIVERRQILSSTDTIFLSLSNTRVASYRFEIDPSVLGNLPLNAFLLDKFLQTETQVSLTAVTNIPFSITSDEASRVSDRFMIVFRPGIINGPLPVNFTEIVAIKNSDKTNTVNWSVANEININGYAVERSGDGNTFTAAGLTAATANNGNNAAYNFLDNSPLKGINCYRIKATSANGQVQYSKVVKLVDNNVKATFTIQPNPVVNKILNLSCENMQGQYTMNLISKQGSLVFSKSITITSINETKNIVIDGGIAAGMYELVLTNNQGKKSVKSIFIK